MLTKENRFDEANSMYNEAIKAADQNLLTLWRDWMIMNIKAYELHKKNDYAYSAISTLPYTLRHKPHKTKLMLAPIFRML